MKINEIELAILNLIDQVETQEDLTYLSAVIEEAIEEQEQKLED